jgi:short-subunit dehydrogenase
MNDVKLAGRTAVVTGAGSGIGRALALRLIQRGCHVALIDIDAAALQSVANEAGNRVRLSVHHLDVADRGAVAALPAQVTAVHPGVDLLFNNAGVAVGGTFEQVSEEDFEWLFDINFFGLVRMTRAFLPLLKQSDDARIINMSSLFGLIAPPGQTAYVASKFAVRGFSASLRHELAATKVGVTVVHPGGVATNISDNARVPKDAPAEEVARRKAKYKKLLRMPAETAADIILKGVERRQARVLVGNDAVAASWLERVAPVSYWRIISRQMRTE